MRNPCAWRAVWIAVARMQVDHAGCTAMDRLMMTRVGEREGAEERGPFSGTGKDYAVPGWSDEQTRYWIDNAMRPKD